MSGVPAHVLAQRVADRLQRAGAYNEERAHEETRNELEMAKYWLDKLREAMA